MNMKLIAIEEHFLTPEIHAAWKNSTLGTEGTDAFDERPEIGDRLNDLGERRLASMDEAGVDVQVLSGIESKYILFIISSCIS